MKIQNVQKLTIFEKMQKQSCIGFFQTPHSCLLLLLTLYKAASDPTYLKRGGGGGAESARTSALGPWCPERPNDDSLLNF